MKCKSERRREVSVGTDVVHFDDKTTADNCMWREAPQPVVFLRLISTIAWLFNSTLKHSFYNIARAATSARTCILFYILKKV